MANPKQVFSKDSAWRLGLYRNLATSLIKHGYVKTNLMRAKELRKKVEKLITLAKKDTLASRRRAAAFLRKVKTTEGKDLLQFLFSDLKKVYLDRAGGYTRILKLPLRLGDSTKMAIIELVDFPIKNPKKSN